jgi:hypothetical protein
MSPLHRFCYNTLVVRQEAKVIGQVIGVAMRLGDSREEGDDAEDLENRHSE